MLIRQELGQHGKPTAMVMDAGGTQGLSKGESELRVIKTISRHDVGGGRITRDTFNR